MVTGCLEKAPGRQEIAVKRLWPVTVCPKATQSRRKFTLHIPSSENREWLTLRHVVILVGSEQHVFVSRHVVVLSDGMPWHLSDML